MKKIYFIIYSISLLVLVLFASCNTNKQTQFPDDIAAEGHPSAKPLVFSKPQSLNWKEISADSINLYKTMPFDYNKLPVKYLDVNDFKPFTNPIIPKKLYWDNLSDSTVNFDTVTAKSLKMQQSIIPKPVITKVSMPKLLANTTAGILQFSEEEGLPGTFVSSFLIDEQGMVWLATNKGLCMYTGEFLYVYTITGETPQGGNFLITNMIKDGSGRIWMSTAYDGIYVMDNNKGILYHTNAPKFAIDLVKSYDGSIWLSGFENNQTVLYVIDFQKQTIKRIPYPDVCIQIKEDKYHNIWMGNYFGVSIISADRKKVKKLSQKQGLNIQVAFKLFEDSKGDMWIGSGAREINIISLKSNTISTINAYNGFTGMATEITEDSTGKVWAIRKDTMYVINKERTAIKNINANITMLQQLKGTSLTDKNGNIWIGTLDKGVIIIDPKGPLPEHLDSKNGLWDSNVWGIMEANDGKIWMGTYNGISIYDPVKKETRLLNTESGAGNARILRIMQFNDDSIIAITASGYMIIDRRQNKIFNYSSPFLNKISISNFTKDAKGHLWMGGVNGLLQLDLKTNAIKLMNKSLGFLTDLIWSTTTDTAGNIWIGTDKGLAVINTVDNTVKYLRQTDGLCNNAVMKIIVKKNGEAWVATQKGIAIIDLKKNTIINITAKDGLVPDAIYDLLEGKEGMYAGSSEGMIFISKTDSAKDKKSEWQFVNYGKKEGFPYNDYNQNAGTVTRSGQLWWGVTPVLSIVTQPLKFDSTIPAVNISGISIMDASPSFFSYKELGTQIKEGDSVFDNSKSKYYFSRSLPKDSGYTIQNDIRWDSTTTLFKLPVGLSLPYHQNSISFQFVNSNIKGRGKILYRYILENEDENWNEATDKAFSKNYFNLSPGNYQFRVCTRGFNGMWSSPADFSFTIRAPWWQTWWAYVLYITGLGSFAWAFAQYRSVKLQRENSLLEEKVTKRTEQLRKSLEELKVTQSQLVQSEKMASLGELTAGIAHEIQNPLNFVNNFSEVNTELLIELKDELDKGNFEDAKSIADDVIANEEKITFHGKRADGIVKGMLQHSRSSNGVKEPTDINALCDEYLRLAYHGLRAKDKSFNAIMKTDFDENIGNINIIPQDIGRVILNLITNAFYAVDEKKKSYHSLKRSEDYEPLVIVTTKRLGPPLGDGGKILITVKDNGNGIPKKILDKIFQPFFTTKPTGQGTGLGLSLSYDIVKAHGGEIKVETEAGEGTTFIITLPATK